MAGKDIFQSTHRVSDATDFPAARLGGVAISIHAPRERCDGISDYYPPIISIISIHAPRERCDPGEMILA